MNDTTLTGLYDTRKGSTIKIHAAGCGMLKTAKPRGAIVAMSEADALEVADEQGFKVVYCKCVVR